MASVSQFGPVPLSGVGVLQEGNFIPKCGIRHASWTGTAGWDAAWHCSVQAPLLLLRITPKLQRIQPSMDIEVSQQLFSQCEFLQGRSWAQPHLRACSIPAVWADGGGQDPLPLNNIPEPGTSPWLG